MRNKHKRIEKYQVFSLLLLVIMNSFCARQKEKTKETTHVILNRDELIKIAGTDSFQVYHGNPILKPGDEGEWDAGALGSMTVVQANGMYHLYYEAWGKLSNEGTDEEYNTLQIGHAFSEDGVNWTKDRANPVLPKGGEGEWDHEGTWDPFVIYEDNIFKMWYGGNMSLCDWGYAISKDGSSFEKKGKISDLGNVEDIHVVHELKNDEYYLYYWDRAQAPWDDIMDGLPSPSGLFVARSKNETNFDFSNAIRLTVKGQDWPVKYSHIIKDNDKWVMFYGEAVTRGNSSHTGMAISENLIDWKKAAFPLVNGHDAEVIEAIPDLWFMYYSPDKYFDMPDCDIRLAIFHGKLDKLSE